MRDRPRNGFMTGCGPSQPDATAETTERSYLTAPRENTKIGTWNVRTMYEASKPAQVLAEMQRFKIDLLGVSEARWTGQGEQRMPDGETILYSGRSDGKHYQGVALILTGKTRKSLIDWKPLNARLMCARFRGRHANVSIIQCYAPTNEDKDNEKEDFYQQLQLLKDKCPRHDITIVMGDLNAKVGSDNTNLQHVMGKEGLGEMNNNGQLLTDFCNVNQLVIGGTVFPHKNIHKWTWKSPQGHQNQIDHMIICKKWRSCLKDVRVKRSADVASDHHLLVASVRTTLSTQRNAPSRSQWNRAVLRIPAIRDKFTLNLINRFNNLTIEGEKDTEPEECWSAFKGCIHKAAEETLGKDKRAAPANWMSAETWEMIEERKKIHKQKLRTKSARLQARLQAEYSNQNRKIKQAVKVDKERFYEERALETQHAADVGDMRSVYKFTKELCGHSAKTNGYLRDAEGNLITGGTELTSMWTEHFRSILNLQDPTCPLQLEEQMAPLDIDIHEPDLLEIKSCLKSLRRNKAPGVDNIPSELLQTTEAVEDELGRLFSTIWKHEKIPEDWSRGIIVKLPKKGNLTDPNNWRGITLLSTASKVFVKILHRRISEAVDERLGGEQAGFRAGRSCTDNIFTLRNIIEQCEEWRSPLYMNFVDFKKAFDSIHRDSIWRILQCYGIPEKLITLIKSFYGSYTCSVLNNENQEPTWFDVKTGVRQGCNLSPLLFIIVTDYIMRRVQRTKTDGLRWNFVTTLNYLAYADDLCLFSTTHRGMTKATALLEETAGSVGLQVNKKKTKVMKMQLKHETPPITVDGEDLEDVSSFVYLGTMVTDQGGGREDLECRVRKATSAFGRLRKVWRSKSMKEGLKIKIYNSNVLSVLLYGCETWRLNSGDAKRLRTFHHRCLRRIFKIPWYLRITNQEVLGRADQPDVLELAETRRWRYLGHILRRPDAVGHTSLSWEPDGTRRRGRPRDTWRRLILKRLKTAIGTPSWSTAAALAKDRELWKETGRKLLKPLYVPQRSAN